MVRDQMLYELSGLSMSLAFTCCWLESNNAKSFRGLFGRDSFGPKEPIAAG